MTILDLITAVVVGTVIGTAGWLAMPAAHRAPWWVSVAVGGGAALLGGFVAQIADASGVTPREAIAQLVFAALGSTIVAATGDRRLSRRGRLPRR